MCSQWLPTTLRARRSAAWCLDPAQCPTMATWERTVALKTCSMLNSPQGQVSRVIMRCCTVLMLFTLFTVSIKYTVWVPSRKASSTKAELLQVWWPDHWGKLNPPGSSVVGLLRRTANAGTEEHCAGQSRNQSQSEYSAVSCNNSIDFEKRKRKREYVAINLSLMMVEKVKLNVNLKSN